MSFSFSYLWSNGKLKNCFREKETTCQTLLRASHIILHGFPICLCSTSAKSWKAQDQNLVVGIWYSYRNFKCHTFLKWPRCRGLPTYQSNLNQAVFQGRKFLPLHFLHSPRGMAVPWAHGSPNIAGSCAAEDAESLFLIEHGIHCKGFQGNWFQ